ncbi:hypothetical protein HKD37_18G050058 [Glycine soja]
MIPRTSSGNSSTSSSHETKVLQQSAPLNIPDWSQIYRNKSNKTTPKSVSRFGDYDDIYHSVNDEGDVDGDGVVNYGGGYSDDEEEEEDEYDTKLPPHEFIARRLARSQISSFSVFEGVGRTLKGRDLSKVRNAVLTKTGFLESLFEGYPHGSLLLERKSLSSTSIAMATDTNCWGDSRGTPMDHEPPHKET